MAAAEGAIAPAGLVYLGYPLHPPGDPAKARMAHLPAVAQPQLFVEGTNDPFIDPHSQLEEAVASCQDATIAWIEGGGHSFEVKGRKRPADEVGAGLAPLVAEFRCARTPDRGPSASAAGGVALHAARIRRGPQHAGRGIAPDRRDPAERPVARAGHVVAAAARARR